jgi:hypothetical protein
MPPENGGYTVAVYIIVPVVFLAYTISLWIRAREMGKGKR